MAGNKPNTADLSAHLKAAVKPIEKGEIPSEAQKSQLEKMIELIEAAIKVIDEAHIEEMPDGKSSGKPAAAITSAQKTSPDIGNNCSRAAKLSKGGTAETETYKQWKSQLETIRNAAKAKLSRNAKA